VRGSQIRDDESCPTPPAKLGRYAAVRVLVERRDISRSVVSVEGLQKCIPKGQPAGPGSEAKPARGGWGVCLYCILLWMCICVSVWIHVCRRIYYTRTCTHTYRRRSLHAHTHKQTCTYTPPSICPRRPKSLIRRWILSAFHSMHAHSTEC
jgi:hypothetical protein